MGKRKREPVTRYFICKYCGMAVTNFDEEYKNRPYCSTDCKKRQAAYKQKLKRGAKSPALDNKYNEPEAITFEGKVLAATQLGMSYGALTAAMQCGNITEDAVRKAISDRRKVIKASFCKPSWD